MAITVSALYYYPVKGCGGRSLHQAHVCETGFMHDREWMVVDASGMFVAQRSDRGLGIGIKSLCLIKADVWRGVLDLNAPGMEPLEVDLNKTLLPAEEVRVWDDTCFAHDEGKEAADWLTEFLSCERPGQYRLMRFARTGQRQSRQGNGPVTFADGYPLLVISQASLDDLNERLAANGSPALPMDRFRPNIVLSGSAPYEEDKLDRLRIGELALVGQTLCIRCPVTTTDQATAQRGKEPLATLATYRRNQNGPGVVFGRNFTFTGEGIIKLNDKVDVLAKQG